MQRRQGCLPASGASANQCPMGGKKVAANATEDRKAPIWRDSLECHFGGRLRERQRP
jgi:hypothetical protein